MRTFSHYFFIAFPAGFPHHFPNIFLAMPSPFNRKKTVGAFGSNKIQPIGHHYEILLNERAEPKAPEAAQDSNRPNIANVIIDFAKPIVSQAGNNRTAIKGAMNVAVLVWNALVEGDAAVAIAREKLLALPDAVPEQIDELLQTMRERRQLVGAGINLLIRKFDLNFTKYGINFSVSAIPGSRLEGVEKSPLLAALGAKPKSE